MEKWDVIEGRYRMRLRGHGFSENEPIDLQAVFMSDDLGTYDTVDDCWVVKNERGEWVFE